MNGMKLIDCYWFTNQNYDQCMGIIKVYDHYQKVNNFYIGFGSGKNEEEDIKEIIKYGTKYTEDHFKEIYKILITAKYGHY